MARHRKIILFLSARKKGGLLREIGMDTNKAFVFSWIKSRYGVP